MTMFPLCRGPATVAFLDDDPEFLETLALVLPRHWQTEMHIRPGPLLERLQADAAHWREEEALRTQTVARWREGESLPLQILRYWAQGDERYELTAVCVVDYAMPAMTGLEFLERVEDWPGASILLTGRADEHIAVSAFNEGLIEHFITKQEGESTARLMQAVGKLLSRVQSGTANPWRASLRPEQLRLLGRPAVADGLERQIAGRGWIEHVVLGDPFGVLGRDAKGRAGWLQLEAPGNLIAPAELAETLGWEAQAVDDLRRGRKVANIELSVAAGGLAAARARPPFALGRDGELLGAFFDLPPDVAEEASARSHAEFLARQPRRRLVR